MYITQYSSYFVKRIFFFFNVIRLRSVSIWIHTENFMLSYKVENFYSPYLVIMAFSKDTLDGQLNTVGWTFGWRLSLIIIKCR